MRLQSAIFDMDGTLLDSMPMWTGLWADLLRRRGIEPEPDLREAMRPLSLRKAIGYCRERYHFPEPLESLWAEIEARVADFYRTRVEAKDGLVPFLSLLKMEGVWMYVATATDRPLAETALERAGISGYFRGIVTCAEAGQGKRDGPAVYERALTRLRSTKRDTVVFEDALFAIRTAKAAGFRVAAVYDPAFAEEQPQIQAISDYYIRSYREMFEKGLDALRADPPEIS